MTCEEAALVLLGGVAPSVLERNQIDTWRDEESLYVSCGNVLVRVDSNLVDHVIYYGLKREFAFARIMVCKEPMTLHVYKTLRQLIKSVSTIVRSDRRAAVIKDGNIITVESGLAIATIGSATVVLEDVVWNV